MATVDADQKVAAAPGSSTWEAGSKVYALANIHAASELGEHAVALHGDEATVVTRCTSDEGLALVQWNRRRDTPESEEPLEMRVRRQNLSLHPPPFRLGQWVQLRARITFASCRALPSGHHAVITDILCNENSTGKTDSSGSGSVLSLVLKAAPYQGQPPFTFGLSSEEVEPAQQVPVGELLGCSRTSGVVDGLPGGFSAGDLVFAARSLIPSANVGSGDPGVIYAGDPFADKLTVRFESDVFTGSPLWVNICPDDVTREPPLCMGRRVRLTMPVKFADGEILESGHTGTLLSDSGNGDLVMDADTKPGASGHRRPFCPPSHGLAVVKERPLSNEFVQQRLRQLEQLAQNNEMTGKPLRNVSFLQHSFWALHDYGIAVGMYDLPSLEDKVLSIACTNRCTVLRKWRPAEPLDGTLRNESRYAFNHSGLIGDKTRVNPYRSAIEHAAPGRKALDVGTGPVCLLARMCLKAGAAHVDAVEASESSVAEATSGFQGNGASLVPAWAALNIVGVRLAEGTKQPCAEVQVDGTCAANGSTQSLNIYKGMSTDTSLGLPGGYGLLVHEILGDFAGTEDAARVVNDIWSRGLLAEGCRCVPCSASSMLAPTAVLRRTTRELLLHRQCHAGTATIEPRVRHVASYFRKEALLAPPQAFEVLDFAAGCPDLLQDRELEFITEREDDFDGVHMHLHVDLDDKEQIDVLEHHNDPSTSSSWRTAYVRLLEEPRRLSKGSRLVFRCHAALDGAVARYSIAVFVGEPGSEERLAVFAWAGG